MRTLAVWTLLMCWPGLCAAASVKSLVREARNKVESGTVEPEADLGPLIEKLANTGKNGDAEKLIDAVVELGAREGSSPAVVKAYLREAAPPALLHVAGGDFDWTVRGEAFLALRALDASDAALREAIALAGADDSKEKQFINSRGKLLEAWLESRTRRGGAPEPPAPADPASERAALLLLREHGFGASADQLMQAALHGQAEIVAAQLAAGVPADGAGAAGLAPLAAAAGAGCAMDQGNLAGRLAVIDALVAAGADVGATQALGNTLLLQSAMLCPLPVVERLVALGADPSPAPNAQGATPLGIALMTAKWDMAEYLIARGARLDAEQIDSIFFELPTDPAQRALVDKARRSE